MAFFYCDYFNLNCDGTTRRGKACSYCGSYRYNVVIPTKWNDDDAFDRARENDETRHLPRRCKPTENHEPDPKNVSFKEKIKILSVKEYHAALDEFEKLGGHPHDHEEARSFLEKKADEKREKLKQREEKEMARKTDTTAVMALQGLNESQIAIVTQSTPKHLIKQRKGRGGKVFDYLPHAEVAKILNSAFNHAWSFQTEPILQFCNENEVTVKGVLTLYGSDGKTIVKEQYGSMDIPHNAQGKATMPFGDALKGAASDSLKKCASLLGIALDLYANGHRFVEPEPETVKGTPEPVKPEPPKETVPVKPVTPEPVKSESVQSLDKITDSQKDLIQKLIKSHVFSDIEREKAISFCEKTDCTKEKADKFIKSLQSHIEIRKENEKKELLQKVMEFRTDDIANFEIAMADFKKAYNTNDATTIEHFNHILAFKGNGNQAIAA